MVTIYGQGLIAEVNLDRDWVLCSVAKGQGSSAHQESNDFLSLLMSFPYETINPSPKSWSVELSFSIWPGDRYFAFSFYYIYLLLFYSYIVNFHSYLCSSFPSSLIVKFFSFKIFTKYYKKDNFFSCTAIPPERIQP